MKILEKIWNFLNGRKTIICSIVIIFLQSAAGEMYVPEEWMGFLLAIFGTLGAGSLVHHVAKSIPKKK